MSKALALKFLWYMSWGAAAFILFVAYKGKHKNNSEEEETKDKQ